jgi:hypothetical protein
MVLVIFAFDAVGNGSVGDLGRPGSAFLHSLRNHISRSNACIVQFRIPRLILRLLFEPATDDQQAVDYTVLVLLATSVFCSLDHFLGNDGRVRFRDDGLLEFA